MAWDSVSRQVDRGILTATAVVVAAGMAAGVGLGALIDWWRHR